jgi:hypothetical protein
MNETQAPPVCSLCGGEVEEWPGGGGYGNNPEPLAPIEARCCDRCNQEKVIPARLEQMGYGPTTATNLAMRRAMEHTLDEFRAQDAPDQIRVVVKHTGPSPTGEGPTTISKEGMETLVDQFTAFVGGRIMARMDEGEDVKQVIVKIDLLTSRTIGEDDDDDEREVGETDD